MVAKQRIHAGIQPAGKTVTVEVDDHTFIVQHGPDTLLVVGRTSRKGSTMFRGVVGPKAAGTVRASEGRGSRR